ncbi:hypothetical protein AAFF_G00227380 [Aldrovandia affinis]|uniref:Uncharacterized protein n=1 Tax=Aldrovandia affinis TaxID=143900 RepID=A0AAD7TBK7_9TELE|nr:hypothetical protein AAFF_G00227380 [Aldrovandia affinis]
MVRFPGSKPRGDISVLGHSLPTAGRCQATCLNHHLTVDGFQRNDLTRARSTSSQPSLTELSSGGAWPSLHTLLLLTTSASSRRFGGTRQRPEIHRVWPTKQRGRKLTGRGRVFLGRSLGRGAHRGPFSPRDLDWQSRRLNRSLITAHHTLLCSQH